MTAQTVAEIASSHWAMLVLFLTVAANGLIPPIPAAVLMPGMAAVAWTTGSPALAVLIPVAVAGSVVGDCVAYLLAERVNIKHWRAMQAPRAQRLIVTCENALKKHAVSFILLVRFLPGGRVASSLAAGVLRYPRRSFFAICVLASLIWACYMSALGILAGTILPNDPLWAALVGVGVGLVLGTGFEAIRRLMSRRRRAATGGQR